MTTGLIYDARFLEHDTGAGHPERPARLTAAMAALDAEAWRTQLLALSPSAADLRWIESIHRLDYIRRAEASCAAGAAFLDTADVAISRASYEIACLAAGAGLKLADALLAGQIDNGFAMVRPPGHHAEHAMALGFCVFNNVAILARYLQQQHGLDKIAILDWDVHHGNGTQHSFEEDPSVLYVSLHQYPYYPGTGSASETGRGRGRGATLNCPMPAGATDSAYERAFQEQVLPGLAQFRPEIILISAGFDAHRDDPLADVQLSTACYGWMTARVMEIAEQYAGGRILSLLEGGYDLQRTGECVVRHLAVLGGQLKA
jgi:acetoin utilization deacetylase AcuC-like enzyme